MRFLTAGPALSLVIGLLLAPGQAALSQERTMPANLVVLPFTNLSTDSGIWPEVSEILFRDLITRGVAIAPDNLVMPILEKRGERWGHTLKNSTLTELRDVLGADAVLMGVMGFSKDGQGQILPQWSLFTRLVDLQTQKTVWWNLSGHTGRDYETVLKLGLVHDRKELLERCMKELLAGLPMTGSVLRSSRSSSRGKSGRCDKLYRAPELTSEPIERVVLLPMKNSTGRLGAALTAEAVFSTILEEQTGWSVAEFADIGEALRGAGLRHTDFIGLEGLQHIAAHVKAQVVLFASVENYVEYQERGGRIIPEVSFQARLVRPSDGKILWSCLKSGAGDSGPQFFGQGYQENILQVVRNTLKAMAGTLTRR